MSDNLDYIELHRNRYAKEKAIREKHIQKRKELDSKIKKCDDNMKKIKEDIENLEIEKTIKAIKLKGYSLSYVQEVIESGVLDHQNGDKEVNGNSREEE